MQSRVDVRTMAELDKYFESKGFRINTVSQLISSSLELLREVLVNNGVIGETIDDVMEAYRHMQEVGLIRRKMKERIGSRMHTAASFQELRAEGVEPKDYAPEQFSRVHNRDKQVAQPVVKSNRSQVNKVIDDDMWEKAQKRIMEEAKKETRERIKMAKNYVEEVEDDPRKKESYKYDKGPRRLSISEIEAKARDIQEKDKEYLKQVNKMTCAPPTMIKKVKE
jgi:hypothetical protein